MHFPDEVGKAYSYKTYADLKKTESLYL